MHLTGRVIIKMRRLLKHKLEDFVDKRKFAETLERKLSVDYRVRVYLINRCKTVSEYNEAFDKYDEMIK